MKAKEAHSRVIEKMTNHLAHQDVEITPDVTGKPGVLDQVDLLKTSISKKIKNQKS